MSVVGSSTVSSRASRSAAMLSIVVVIAAMISLPVPAHAEGCDLAGGGSSENPHVITAAADMLQIRDCGLDLHYRLIDGFDATTPLTQPVTTMGGGPHFTGTLDGNGQTLRFAATANTNEYGMFALMEGGAIVRNLVVEVDLTAGDNRNSGTATLAGVVRGNVTFDEVTVTGSVGNDAAADTIGGLVGRIASSGTVVFRNVSLIDLRVSGRSKLGGLIGEADFGTNIVVDRVLLDNTEVVATHTNAGGLIGRAGDAIITVENSQISGGEISASGDQAAAGGLVGYATAASSLSAAATHVGRGTTIVAAQQAAIVADQAGAFVGETWGTVLLEDATAKSAITVSEGSGGGLIGVAVTADVTLRRTSAHSAVDATGSGGLIGTVRGGTVLVDQSQASGDIKGSFVAGGLIGMVFESAAVTIQDSYVYARVEGDNGGILGLVTPADPDVTINRVYAVNVRHDATAGGIVGADGGASLTVTASFWDAEASGTSTTSGGGTGLSTAPMKQFTTFDGAGWAIVDGWAEATGSTSVWGICGPFNDGYPYLLWEVSPSLADAENCVASGGGTGSTTGGTSAGSSTAGSSNGQSPLLRDDGSSPAMPHGTAQFRFTGDSWQPLTMTSDGTTISYAGDDVELSFTGLDPNGNTVPTGDGGLVIPSGGDIECEICLQLSAGQPIQVWLFSSPVFAGSFTVEDGLPCQKFTVSAADLANGQHTLQLHLPMGSGQTAFANLGFTVAGSVPTGVPAGEQPTSAGVTAGVLVALTLILALSVIAMRVVSPRR